MTNPKCNVSMCPSEACDNDVLCLNHVMERDRWVNGERPRGSIIIAPGFDKLGVMAGITEVMGGIPVGDEPERPFVFKPGKHSIRGRACLRGPIKVEAGAVVDVFGVDPRDLEPVLELARSVAGWIGALAPLDNPNSAKAVEEGTKLVELIMKLKKGGEAS